MRNVWSLSSIANPSVAWKFQPPENPASPVEPVVPFAGVLILSVVLGFWV
jgi:hypothetical protein